jgi:methyl-accepting chemotaxis protein
MTIAGLTLLVTDRVVTTPVRRLAESFSSIAEGRGDLTQRLEVARQDEIGELAESFNSFISSIQRDVSAMAEQAEALSAAADDLTDLSTRISTSTQTNSGQADAVSNAAGMVSENVGNVASATSQMSASIREIAANAAHAAEVAEEAVRLSETTSERFADLGEGAEGISTFAKVIDSIAAQTNLLALNATIEAARAGDAGRGFAVVAAEVKELAAQSSESTREIRDRLDVILSSIEAAGEVITKVISIIHQINDIQGVIATAVEQQTATTSEINQNVSGAAMASGEIAQSTATFADAMRDSSATSLATLEAAEKLATIADRLESIVSRFKY